MARKSLALSSTREIKRLMRLMQHEANIRYHHCCFGVPGTPESWELYQDAAALESALVRMRRPLTAARVRGKYPARCERSKVISAKLGPWGSDTPHARALIERWVQEGATVLARKDSA